MKCYVCNQKMVEDTDLIIHNGKTYPQSIYKCKKCGESVVTAKEYERIRKEIHPSFFSRLRNIFHCENEVVDLNKGKLL